MHITRIQAAVSFTVPLTHALDIQHNTQLSRAAEARDYAVKQISERGKRVGFCPECIQANVDWYKLAFDKSIEALKRTGTCQEPLYPEFTSPCWSKPETANGALA